MATIQRNKIDQAFLKLLKGNAIPLSKITQFEDIPEKKNLSDERIAKILSDNLIDLYDYYERETINLFRQFSGENVFGYTLDPRYADRIFRYIKFKNFFSHADNVEMEKLIEEIYELYK